MLVNELAEKTWARWRQQNAKPSEAIMDQLHAAAGRGFSWCTVPQDQLTADNLRWLSAEGCMLQKLPPRNGESTGYWRITWVRLPVHLGLQPEPDQG